MAEDETNSSQRVFEAGAASAPGDNQQAAQTQSGDPNFPHGAQGNSEVPVSGNGAASAGDDAGEGGGGAQAGAGDGGGNTADDGSGGNGGDGGGAGGDGTGGGGTGGDGTGGDGTGGGGGGSGGDGEGAEGPLGQVLGLVPEFPPIGGVPPIGGIGDNQIVDTVNQAVGAIGSGGALDDILNGDLLNEITDQLNDLLDAGGDGLGDGLGGDGVGGLVETVVADASQTAGAVAGGGSADGILNAVGSGAGTLVDDALGAVDGATGSGVVGDLLGGLGDEVVNGSVGGGGLLSGTPLEGLSGDGALISTNVLNGDNSSSASLLQVGAGTDQSDGLINVNAAAARSEAESNHIVDTNIGPDASGSGVTADLLGADQDASGSLADADMGQHDGASLVGINAGTAADSFEFPALDGTGLDSLVGEIGPIEDDPIGGDLLPLSAGVDGEVLVDIGATGTVDAGDNRIDDGTHVMVNTPLQGGLGLG
jgi:hypothetical protein